MGNPIYYYINRIDHDTVVDSIELKKGYYRFMYDLGGNDIEHASQYSTDRDTWVDFDKFKSLSEYQETFEKVQPRPMLIDRMEYVETVVWKDNHVPVFLDDYGQCFYCIFNNKVMAFGTFQGEYEDEIRDLVDYELAKAGKSK